MKTFNYWTLFLVVLMILYVFLGVYMMYYSNSSRLKKRNYKPEYIEFIKKDLRKRILGIGFVIPILMLLSVGLVWLVKGGFNINEGLHIFLFTLFFTILVAPFPILEQAKTNKKYKELAIKSESEIIIDYNHLVLHLIFKPFWEFITAAFYILFMFWIIRDIHPAFFHVAILWFLYLAARSAKFYVAPALRDTYLYVFVFLSINHFLLIFHLLRETLFLNPPSSMLLIGMGLVLAAVIVLKWFYYLFNISELKNRFSNE